MGVQLDEYISLRHFDDLRGAPTNGAVLKRMSRREYLEELVGSDLENMRPVPDLPGVCVRAWRGRGIGGAGRRGCTHMAQNLCTHSRRVV